MSPDQDLNCGSYGRIEDIGWVQIEKRFEELCGSDLGRLQFSNLDEVIDFWNSHIQSGVLERSVQALMQAAECLAKGKFRQEIWKWIFDVARNATPITKEALRVAILDLMPEEPLIDEDLFLVWRASRDQALSWMIDTAYENHKDLRVAHKMKYGE